MTDNKFLNINGKTKIAGVTGNPISHSKSPKIHNFWLNENNIDGVYIPIPIKVGDFNDVVKSMAKIGIMGMNVTSPYKIEAYNICDELSDCAREIGAVNTLTFKDNGTIHGDCTDAYGFYQALIDMNKNFTIKDKVALVIGAGGASRAIIWQLIHENASKVIIANRTISKAEDIVKSLNIQDKCEVISINDMESHLQDIHLLVNTTTLGATKENDLHINLENLNKNATVYDILYNPTETTLLQNAKANGNPYLNGEGMLLHQAVPAFTRWFKIKPDVTSNLYKYIYG